MIKSWIQLFKFFLQNSKVQWHHRAKTRLEAEHVHQKYELQILLSRPVHTVSHRQIFNTNLIKFLRQRLRTVDIDASVLCNSRYVSPIWTDGSTADSVVQSADFKQLWKRHNVDEAQDPVLTQNGQNLRK